MIDDGWLLTGWKIAKRWGKRGQKVTTSPTAIVAMVMVEGSLKVIASTRGIDLGGQHCRKRLAGAKIWT